jgi:hypothetical protein
MLLAREELGQTPDPGRGTIDCYPPVRESPGIRGKEFMCSFPGMFIIFVIMFMPMLS